MMFSARLYQGVMPLSQQLKVPLSNQHKATRSGSSQQRQWQRNLSVPRRAQGTSKTVGLNDEVEDVDDDAEDKKDRRKGEHQEWYCKDADGDEEEHLSPYLEIGKVGGVRGFGNSVGLRGVWLNEGIHFK
jgi:hypothetical protein